MDMRKELRHIGLIDGEINVYLFLLKNGASKALEISKGLGVARTTIYRFLESLKDKGLVSERLENNVRIFIGVDPEKIPDVLESRILEVRSVIKDLKKLEKKKVKEASVQLFRGKEGIKIILNDIFRACEDYAFMGESEKFFEELEIFSSQWVRKIEELKIRGRLLCPKGQHFEVAKNEEVRFIDPKLLSNTSTWIYGNKVAQFIWDEPFYVVLIESESVAAGQMKVFDYLWKLAK